ncbi:MULTISPECIES: hypothetical protein [unclassified Okeania]|nr:MULTISPECIES: hypothetical protein [unclassified Okeania]
MKVLLLLILAEILWLELDRVVEFLTSLQIIVSLAEIKKEFLG